MKASIKLIFLSLMVFSILLANPLSGYANQTTYQYEEGNQLSELITNNGTVFYENDQNGNVTRKGKHKVTNREKNMLINPLFETGTQELASVWGKVVNGTTTASFILEKNGKHKQQKIISSNIAHQGMVGISQTISVIPHKMYEIQASLAINQLTNADVQLLISYLGNSGNQEYRQIEASNTQTKGIFTTISGTATIPANVQKATIYIVIRANGHQASGEIVVKGMNVSKTFHPIENLNHDFQLITASGNSMYWDKVIHLANHADFTTSQRGVQKIVGAGIAKDGEVAINQRVKVSPNTAYNFNGIFVIDHLKNATAQLYVQFLDGQGNIIKSHFVKHPYAYTKVDPKNPVFKVDTSITLGDHVVAPSSAQYAVVYAAIRALENDAAGTITVDDIVLQRTTEKNILSNPELNVPYGNLASGWALSGLGINHSNHRSDTEKSIQIFEVKGTPSVFGTIGILQRVSVYSKKSFNIHALVYIPELEGSSVQVNVQFYDSNDKAMGSNYVEEVRHRLTNHYGNLNVKGDIPEGAVTASVSVFLNVSGTFDFVTQIIKPGFGKLHIDKISMEVSNQAKSNPTPEPPIPPWDQVEPPVIIDPTI
ncbi:carbohydrate binding domain-containing protein [Paenibacillus sp. 481]|uniref:carbohydrate binding domain-containing protein n=1 Tax=Paenibacillus sp. 481 TaxID=2835869 RepID=UPI001E5BFF7E|nr:carbohydrate binding domain-containing protein [Paenibacillus sp. 481]UHA71909.1 carbohydrate binding domain-containing protein [Paenibacillus sp. 481]